ncbi:MAG: MptD family putative ECF transporter S component [Treponema sp.]|nr:MptD family putative ECF transporter S component [Treponema sp.]
METNNKRNALNARDLITIGILAAISLVIFMVTGIIAGVTIVGTIYNIPITSFFVSIAYMLLVARVRKPGTFFIMGTINSIPGLMAANIFGVVASIIGWGIADLISSLNNYRNKKILVLSYVAGATLHAAFFTFPMFASGGQYILKRQEAFHLTDAVIAQYIKFLSWPIYSSIIALTAVASLVGAIISIRILKKHFEKAGLL